jgi:hypothetical protein|tara:strand:- start:219 stop:449 length:231 start_codon:yes stop_codon:yes gene_type:complete
MIKNMNNLLELNDVQVRIGSTWYKLDEICPIDDNSFPIFVSDDDGESFEFDMADVDEFDPIFNGFREMDRHIVGIA